VPPKPTDPLHLLRGRLGRWSSDPGQPCGLHWIGLDRARHQFEQLTDQEKRDSGGLVEPDVVADTVVTLALGGKSAGIVVIRADRNPTTSTSEAPIRMSTQSR
jgi:hypothetical protein